MASSHSTRLLAQPDFRHAAFRVCLVNRTTRFGEHSSMRPAFSLPAALRGPVQETHPGRNQTHSCLLVSSRGPRPASQSHYIHDRSQIAQEATASNTGGAATLRKHVPSRDAIAPCDHDLDVGAGARNAVRILNLNIETLSDAFRADLSTLNHLELAMDQDVSCA
jgi:hypothetical protein